MLWKKDVWPELDVARRRLLEVHPAPVGPRVLEQEVLDPAVLKRS